MADIPVLHQTLRLPTDKQHGIGATVKHALMFAPAMTDIIIHEGHVIRAKSARGTLPLHQLFAAIPPFIVTREHIVTYLAGYVDGGARPHRGDRGQALSVQEYWDTRIKPVPACRRSVNIRLDGRGGHSLRYSLSMHGTWRTRAGDAHHAARHNAAHRPEPPAQPRLDVDRIHQRTHRHHRPGRVRARARRRCPSSIGTTPSTRATS